MENIIDNNYQQLVTNIGLKVRKLREEKGISQEVLSFETKIHRTQVSRIELGQNNVSIRTISKLVDYFQINYPDFFNFSDL